jgi:hypothetical protein
MTMGKKELAPIENRTEWWESVYRILRDELKQRLYLPILRSLEEVDPDRSDRVQNSVGKNLAWAIQRGRVTFHLGMFVGKFSAAVSSELRELGAKWLPATRGYKIDKSALPREVVAAINSSRAVMERAAEAMDRKLREVAPEELADLIDVGGALDKAIFDVNRRFDENARGIIVAPKLTIKELRRVRDEYALKTKMGIKEWTRSETVKLRKDVQVHVQAGGRYEDLIKLVHESYGATLEKAKFIARQETMLLTTKLKQIRYESAGVKKYRWVTVHMPHDKKGQPHHLGNVRYGHAVLADAVTDLGKGVYTWNNPPMIVDGNGRPLYRRHPGQDWNCRCVAIPIVDFRE